MQAGENAVSARPVLRERSQDLLRLVLLAGLGQHHRIRKRIAASCRLMGAPVLLEFVARNQSHDDESAGEEIRAIVLKKLDCLVPAVVFIDLAEKASSSWLWLIALVP